MADILSKSRLDAWRSKSCEDKILDIIDFSSPLTSDRIADTLERNPDATLGSLKISSSSADRKVRRLINKRIRKPAGKPALAKYSLKVSVKIASLINENCNS